MENLTNISVSIGREKGRGRLFVSVKAGRQVKNTALGQDSSVPNCVSHSDPVNDVAHCRIDIDSEGNMVLSNLNPRNVTYVNDVEIVSKKITPQSRISLGVDKYQINLNAILAAGNQLMASTNIVASNKVFSILPLKAVWEDYENSIYRLQKRQKNLGVVRSMYIPLTILSSLAGFVATKIGLNETVSTAISYCMYALAILFLFYGLYRTISDKSLEEKKVLDRNFQEKYVCPNPDCNRFMGNQPYNIFRQNTFCPYCKCKFTDKETV